MQRTKQGKLSGRSAGLSVGRRSLQKGGGGGRKNTCIGLRFCSGAMLLGVPCNRDISQDPVKFFYATPVAGYLVISGQ